MLLQRYGDTTKQEVWIYKFFRGEKLCCKLLKWQRQRRRIGKSLENTTKHHIYSSTDSLKEFQKYRYHVLWSHNVYLSKGLKNIWYVPVSCAWVCLWKVLKLLVTFTCNCNDKRKLKKIGKRRRRTIQKSLVCCCWRDISCWARCSILSTEWLFI